MIEIPYCSFFHDLSQNVKQKDLSHIDRNLDSLVQDLAARCQKIFVEAAGATARSSIVVSVPPHMRSATGRRSAYSDSVFLIRERTTFLTGQQVGSILFV